VERFPEDPAALADLDTARLLDIGQYCENAVAHAVVVLFVLGCILRLLTALAVAYCPRGLRLEGALAAAARAAGKGRRRRRRAAAAAQAAEAAASASQRPQLA
jgi:hypothetical protein